MERGRKEWAGIEEREREEGKEKGDGGKEVEVNVLPTLSTICRPNC